LRIVWSDRALLHIDRVGSYLAQHNPRARVRVLDAIARNVLGLAAHPFRGRVGRVAATRELAVPRTPYVVAYRVTQHTIDILAVVHGAQRWPKRL
jgi:addiction module RelE/StbE family toxin